MPTATSHRAPVLDYAPQIPPNGAVRRLRVVLIVLSCMLIGLIAGGIVHPARYHAVGFVQVASTRSIPLLYNEQDERDARAAQRDAAAGLVGLPNLQAVSQQFSGTITPAQIAAGLHVQPVPDSRLVSVAFTDADPKVAAATVNAVMMSYGTGNVTVAVPARIPTRPEHRTSYLAGGATVGLLAALVIVARRGK